MSGRTAATHRDAGTAKLCRAGRHGDHGERPPIWRRVQPWAYRSAARLTSTAPPYPGATLSECRDMRACTTYLHPM